MQRKITKNVLAHSLLSIALALVLVGLAQTCKHFDAPLRDKVLTHYLASNLYQFELQQYKNYQQRQLNLFEIDSPEKLHRLKRLEAAQQHAKIASLILSDRAFYRYLERDGRVFMADARYKAWLSERRDVMKTYDSLSSQRFGLIPSSLEPADLITYLFIDYRPISLWLNVVLLLVLGPYIESVFGRARLLQGVFAGGLLGGLCYAFVAGIESPVLLGFDLSIAALFGQAWAGLWGTIKSKQARNTSIRQLGVLLLTLAIVFGLKLWATWWFELLPLKACTVGLGIALIAAALTRCLGKVMEEQAASDERDSDAQLLQFRTELSQAMSSISRLDFNAARKKLKTMLQDYPHEPHVLKQLYNLEKLSPEAPLYWACAKELINFGVKYDDYELIKPIFTDIQKNAASKALAKEKLAPEDYHKMLTVFISHDDMNKAEQCFLFLELAGQTSIIKDACLLLIQEFNVRRNVEKAKQYNLLLTTIEA